MPSIGRYVVERELGRGAMGVVYLARDPQLGRQVAVKTYVLPDGISPALAKEFQERFQREARAAASLTHPGIVTVYDAGEDPATGLPYIAMEYVAGRSLKEHLDKSPRPDPKWVLSFGAVLADALHKAHQAGIVHRDIKPANILISDQDGAVKIADFGVARLQSSELTRSGVPIGSPGYMSPEQVRGGALDGRSDLFSLAVVLYEAFCGKRPFRGDDLISLAYAIAHDTQVPLARQMPACPSGLDKFFDRALSKDPARRFADGAAFREALQKAFVEVGTPDASDRSARTLVAGDEVASATVPMAGRRGRSLAWKSAALCLVAAGLLAAAYVGFGRAFPLMANARQQSAAPPEPSAGPMDMAPAASAETSAAASAAASGPASREEILNSKPDPQAKLEREPSFEVTPVPPPPPRPAKSIPAKSIKVTVPAGSEIHVVLDQAVGSATSQVGQSVTARVTDPVVVAGREVIPAGSRLLGRVVAATPAKKGLGDKAGSITLAFERLATPGGSGSPMAATLTRAGRSSGGKTAGAIGGGAAGGALLGKILGHRSKDAVIGTALGGAIGTGIAAGTKGDDVELSAGAPLLIALDEPLALSVAR